MSFREDGAFVVLGGENEFSLGVVDDACPTLDRGTVVIAGLAHLCLISDEESRGVCLVGKPAVYAEGRGHIDRLGGSGRLAGTVRYRHIGEIAAGVLGEELKGECPVRSGRRLEGHGILSVAGHLSPDSRRGEAVAREGLNPALHGDGVAGGDEFLGLVEADGEGREDEIIHAERIAADILLIINDFEGIIAVALSPLQKELAGNGAEFRRRERLGGDFLVRGVLEFHLHLFPGGKRFHFAAEVAFEENGLELHPVIGIVGPPVLVDIAENIIRE